MEYQRLRFSVAAGGLVTALGFLLWTGEPAAGQQAGGAVLTGQVTDVESGDPVVGAFVSLEGLAHRALTDGEGRYRLAGLPSGPQVLEVRHLGYAPRRVPVSLPSEGVVTRDVELSVSALRLEGITVVADAQSRARGELGTASVIGREAILAQSAASLAGVLELVPGMQLSPPGLDGVQQVSLRSTPTSPGPASVAGPGVSASALAAFGTLIVIDGIPLSNNSNLQTGGLGFPTAAGGGIDLRRIPAATIERVEVLRGIPSARYGDLTQGAILVETRAGVVPTNLAGRIDQRTGSASLTGGRQVWNGQGLSVSGDWTRTRVAPGVTPDNSHRFTFQLAHRAEWGDGMEGAQGTVADTRVDLYRLTEDRPEDPGLVPGLASWSRETGVRLSHRLRLIRDRGMWTFQGALDVTSQRSFGQRQLTRSAMPFTDQVGEGRTIGEYVEGQYLAVTNVDGRPWFAYARAERELGGSWLSAEHALRAGAEFRREWNAGPGLQYDPRFPPQITFSGVRGHNRPRAFDDVPALAVSALYLDDRIQRGLGGRTHLNLQAGLRTEILHDEGSLSDVRDVSVQPRVNAEVVLGDRVRVRSGWGRTAKTPSMLQLHPAPDYYDLVNVNWFTNAPEERLAVMSTFIRDRENPDLGFATADKLEAGIEVALGTGAAVELVAFQERMNDAIGLRAVPEWIPRERFQLADSTIGTGQPPEIIEPAYRVDTIPILVQRPANHLRLRTEGLELIGTLPEIRPLRLRAQFQATWSQSDFRSSDFDYGQQSNFEDMQIRDVRDRTPYWAPSAQLGERAMLTYRLVHHNPSLGFVVTGTVQHMLYDDVSIEAASDSLAFEGYLTRDGRRVEVPVADRGLPEYADLRQVSRGTGAHRRSAPADWIMAVQATKTLAANGRVTFWAYNLFDHIGYFGEPDRRPRSYPGMRFGLEVMIPAEVFPW